MRAVMSMTEDKALWLQETVLEFNGWQWGLVNFAYGQIASFTPETEARWQFGVDIFYRTLTCDLVRVDVFMEARDRTSLIDAIRRVSPFENSGGLLWNGTQVSGTDRLSELATAHFPSSGELNHTLNPSFIEALEAIFAANGVPWSDKPLLPIIPAGAVAGAPR